jgi:hypothetical protein
MSRVSWNRRWYCTVYTIFSQVRPRSRSLRPLNHSTATMPSMLLRSAITITNIGQANTAAKQTGIYRGGAMTHRTIFWSSAQPLSDSFQVQLKPRDPRSLDTVVCTTRDSWVWEADCMCKATRQVSFLFMDGGVID